VGVWLVLLATPLWPQALPPLCLHFDPPTMVTVTDPISATLLVRNASCSHLTVLSTTIELPEALTAGSRRGELPVAHGTFDLDPNGSKELKIRAAGVGLGAAWQLLFYRHQKYRGTIRLRYEVVGEANRPEHVLELPFFLNPLSTWWAVAVGGILGVILVMGFRWLWGKYRAATAPVAHPPHWLTLGVGSLVVLLAVFLFRLTAMEMPELPITFHVKDFYGGVLIGLAFEPLANWFSELVKSK